MSSDFFLKSFRILLLPFAMIYWLILGIRNWMFDKKIFRSLSFGLPVIGVGNLSVGGTGKTPIVEWMVKELKNNFKLAVLSRGYMRKTKGYALANEHSTALEIGDEPLQLYQRFPDIPIAVGESRLEAIPQLLHDRPDISVIILDDSFQHRSIRPGLNILLTDYRNLFRHDFYLPTGDLRDLKSSYKRAQIVIVTKCPPGMSTDEKEKLIKEIRPLSHQEVYFTAIEYGQPYHFFTGSHISLTSNMEILLVTGIANPKALEEMVEQNTRSYHRLQFADHHIYTIDDLAEIKKRFKQLEAIDKIILTTEKDAVRFLKFKNEIESLPFFIQPISHKFLFNGKARFLEKINAFVSGFKRGSTQNEIAGQNH
jgi:tetraacyldisaccharide 4'-kinase